MTGFLSFLTVCTYTLMIDLFNSYALLLALSQTVCTYTLMTDLFNSYALLLAFSQTLLSNTLQMLFGFKPSLSSMGSY